MSRPARQISPEAGFTLVELLVAVTLLGFVSVLLFGGLRLGTRVWERTRTGFESDRAVHAAEAAMADAIGHAYPRLVRKSPTESEVAFTGSSSNIALTAWSGDAGLASVVIATKQDGQRLVLTVASHPELQNDAAPSTTVLAGVASVAFGYFGVAAGEKGPRWHSDWQGQRVLPSLVRIAVRMQDGRQTPLDLIVTPRIEAPMNCILDVLTNDCQGR